MIHRLIIWPQAEADIAEVATGYQEQRSGLGEEFIAESDAAMQNAVANPRQYPRLRRKPEVRRILTKRFPYRIFFVVRTDAVIVFRVLHGARHDREWKRKLPEA